MFTGYLARLFSTQLIASFLAVGIVTLLETDSRAAIISNAQIFGSEAGTGTGLGTVDIPVFLSPDTNNDNQAGGGTNDDNLIVPIKRFDNIGYIDIVFNLNTSGGVTEYKFFESVDNNTGVPWSSYIMQLGFGTGLGFNNVNGAGDGLDFDFPNFDLPPASTAFSSVVTSEDMLVFSSGLMGAGAETFEFRIDVPDGITSFTLRQTPVAVPEPGTWGLIAMASLALLSRRFGFLRLRSA